MYNTTEMLNAAILGDTRKFYARITGENGDVSEEIKNIKQYTDIGSNGTITIGGAISSYVTISLWETDLQIEGKEITVEIGIELETGDIAWIPLDKFIADTPKKSSDGLIEFTAYDRIQTKLSGAFFSELNYPADAINVLNEISAKTGVPIDTSNLTGGITISQRKIVSSNEIDSSGNVIENITYENPFNGYTYREALGYLAMLYCKYAVSGRDGTIKFVWYEETGQSITADYYYDGLQTAELAFAIGTITCNTGEDELKSGTGTNNIQLENPVMTQERLDYIYSQVQKLQFIPASFSFYGNHLLDAGDIVSLVKTDGTIYKVPIMNIYHEFDGGLKTTVQSYGGAEQENANKGALLSRLERQYTELLLVKELVGNKASFDYVYALAGDFKTLNADYGGFKELVADDFEAVNAEIKSVKANNITTDNLNAELANIGVLTVTEADLKYATIESLNVAVGEFDLLKAKAITTDNLSSSVASLGYATIDETDIRYAKITTLETEYLKLENLSTETAKLGYATVEELEVTNGNFDSLNADYASFKSTTTQSLTAQQADITKLSGDYANFKSGEFAVLKADHAALETLVNGNLTSANIQSLTLTAQNTTIANGMIKNAMIDSLAFSKITGVDINTTNLTIHSEDGKSKWSDNTIQISDATRVRVQIGKDASGDYTLALWDSSGKLIWDALGATEHTIQRKIIRDAVVADDAAIAGSKLDIDSVVQEVNGAQTKLNSTTILVDETSQTLDVYLNTLETTVGDNLDAAKLYADGQLSTAQQYALTAAENALASAKSYTDALEIGGRNLLSDTQRFNTNKTTDMFVKDIQALPSGETYCNCVARKYSKTIDSTDKSIIVEYGTLTPEYGQSYTFSFWAKGSGSFQTYFHGDVGYVRVESFVTSTGKKGDTIDGRVVWTLTDEWKRYWVTYTLRNTGDISAGKSLLMRHDGDLNTELTASIAGLKLEYGTKATDWTPAPEDAEEKITSLTEITTAHTTNVSVMQGQISSLIAEDTTIKGDYDALVSRYNATVADVSSIKTTIAEHTTLIDSQTQDILAVQTKASTLESSLDGFRATVSETYTTKAEFEGLEIGGRNLLLNSNFENTGRWNGLKAGISEIVNEGIDGTNCIKLTGALEVSTTITNALILSVKPNEKYTFSGWCKTDSVEFGTTNPFVCSYVYYLSDDLKYADETPIYPIQKGTVGWTYVEKTFKVPNNENIKKMRFQLYARDFTGTVWWDNIKLERGTKATDWTPAPEDAEEKINSLETWKTEASQKITKDGIIATVGNYYAYQSDLASAENRLATAETTIAQHTKQIALTVKESDVTGNYLVGKINLSSTTAQIAAKNIDLSGYVTVSSLSTAGATTIDGANIKTGTIDAERIDVDALMAMELTATNLHVTGDSVFDGKLNGATGTFAGSLSAASGTFTGVLSGATGSFSGSVTATSLNATKSGKISFFEFSNNGMWADFTGDGVLDYCFDKNLFSVRIYNDSSVERAYIYMDTEDTTSKINGRLNLFANDNISLWTNGKIRFINATDYSEKVVITKDGDITADGSITTENCFIAGSTSYNQGWIELYGSTPYIDFHFGNSTADYTSRIIEDVSGRLNFVCDTKMTKWLYMGGSNYLYWMDYGGGWYMNDTTWMRVANNKNIYTGGLIKADGGVDATVLLESGSYRKPVGSSDVDGNKCAVMKAYSTYFSLSGQWGTAGASFSTKNFTASSSDIRLKTNVLDTDITALPVINQMQVRQFDWIDNGIHQKIGFIADELELLDPALAIGGGYDEDGNMDVKSVNDFYLLGYLTKGIQELYNTQLAIDDEILTIKTEQDSHWTVIEQLMDENAALKKRIEQLEQQIA